MGSGTQPTQKFETLAFKADQMPSSGMQLLKMQNSNPKLAFKSHVTILVQSGWKKIKSGLHGLASEPLPGAHGLCRGGRGQHSQQPAILGRCSHPQLASPTMGGENTEGHLATKVRTTFKCVQHIKQTMGQNKSKLSKASFSAPNEENGMRKIGGFTVMDPGQVPQTFEAHP